MSIAETAKAAEFFLSDGVIVTGTSTGIPTSPQDIQGIHIVALCENKGGGLREIMM